MNTHVTIEQKKQNGSTVSPKLWAKRISQSIAGIVVLNGALLLIAGRVDWLGAWVLSFLYFVFILVFIVWTLRNDPELMEERMKHAENVKAWDKIIMTIYTVMLVVMLVVAALDAGRFRWSTMPLALQTIGAIGMLPLGGWILWVTATNSYLSRFARIQEDRGQQVVTAGPYRYVRHPMYAAIIPFILCVVFILGSWWALVPGAIIAILFIIRTALEDRMLQQELPGYTEYAQKVRYRLLPGVW
jgi:protein-S-isoprenylcysteine O-methyltransferase Ste14